MGRRKSAKRMRDDSVIGWWSYSLWVTCPECEEKFDLVQSKQWQKNSLLEQFERVCEYTVCNIDVECIGCGSVFKLYYASIEEQNVQNQQNVFVKDRFY